MNKLFIELTFAGLATALACVNACAAGNLAIDGTGNLFAASSSSHSIFKFTPDGKKSTFASKVNPDKMVIDGAGNLFVAEEHFQEDRHADSKTFGAWPLMERAISLWWTLYGTRAARFLNSHLMGNRAPSHLGSALAITA